MKIIERIKSRRELQKRIDNHYKTMKIDSIRKAIEYMDYITDIRDRKIAKVVVILFVVLVMFAVYLVS
jgi:hypothetical protein